MRRAHLAVVLPRYIESFLAGRKRLEVRLSVSRSLPYGRVSAGDIVYIKERAGPVRCRARVALVETLDNLTPARVRTLERRCARAADAVGAPYWHARRTARYATLVWVDRVQTVRRPMHVPRFHGGAWRILQPGSLSGRSHA